MARVKLDLNNAEFQSAWFALERDELVAFMATLRKLNLLEWQQVYRDKGLNWEAIGSKSGPHGQTVYSLRVTRKMRATAYRDGEVMKFLGIHPDHDSAYQ
jgi:hypothetical protein